MPQLKYKAERKEEEITFFSVDYDEVIKSRFLTAATTYRFSLEKLFPLIDRLDIQRNIQDSKYYSRLELDLVKGCVMPPLTLAFINPEAVEFEDIKELSAFVDGNISEGFILDGIQRLNTLQRSYKKHDGELDLERTLYLNIVICSSMDNLLYRMITLNNGQRPMSAKHQIEILTSNLFEFSDADNPVYTEKEKKKLPKVNVSFSKADFVKGYLAFVANSTNIENQKIIEEKLDELIADKILDSDLTDNKFEFINVVDLINKFSTDQKVFKWFRNVNNLMGFCVGIRKSYDEFGEMGTVEFAQSVELFEHAFGSFNFSKIKVGRIRRNLVSYFIAEHATLKKYSNLELVDTLSQVD